MLARTASLNIRIDPETKRSAEQLFSAFGITLTDAVTMFLRQSIITGGLPFELKLPQYNAEMLAAMAEANKLAKSGMGFDTAQKLLGKLKA
ncbi:DNA-damage-inducible protein J [Dendrosporobacter quercicolus]|uniref:DNA-damage-inducible protein J n=1 Tax=Dendrosporobacter quercicolus TaxID=146817 RepID=A0A1G9Q5Z4_9FIRM|nr:type II toxin-antitoxin system RelB/DinJ family antitoxin [Dendrosporobacter quercicolus]SDM06343.1 DNA-damage-inducible protein J [Dendrosporobacter quercicolus]